jgi:RES domain-containing protein
VPLDDFLVAWNGPACRHLRDDPSVDVTNFHYAGRAPNNRWNDRGQPTLYLAGDHGVLIAELARHHRVDRPTESTQETLRRRIYDMTVHVDRLLDLRDPRLCEALSLVDVPSSFLNRETARATARFLRLTTPAQALLVPSMAFLDDDARWVLVLFLEKRSPDPSQFLTDVAVNGTFQLDPSST